jgi:arylsulfatase A
MKNSFMTRRTILGKGAVAAAAAVGAGAIFCGKGAPPGGVELDTDVYTRPRVNPLPVEKAVRKKAGFAGPRPNVVIINCDDLGYGDLGCYGNTAIRTPNIDGLARGGMRFTDFYASCSVCTPSRYGLLTGRYPIRSGLIFVLPAERESFGRKTIRFLGRTFGRIGAVDVQDDAYAGGIQDDDITLARALKVAGYRTGMVGKWHLGDFSENPTYNPTRHGFDEFFGVPHSNDMFPWALYRNEERLEADIGRNQERVTGMYTKEAVDFINRSKGKPFFLYMAHTFPHQPLYASKRFKDKSKVGIFGDVVEELDWSVGEVLKCLRGNGLEGNTVVIFTSDNGPWFNGSSGGFRGRKGQTYEGGFRVPLIVKWPGRTAPGSVCGEASMNIDIFPTVLSLAGLELPADRVIDGKSVAGLLTGREKKSPHEALYFYHYEELEGVRAGRWKYFRNVNHYVWPQPTDKPTTLFGKISRGGFARWPNLYDLEYDRAECYDVSARYPDVVLRMEAMIKKWDRSVAENPRGWVGGK